jgi:hypothetical protein
LNVGKTEYMIIRNTEEIKKFLKWNEYHIGGKNLN